MKTATITVPAPSGNNGTGWVDVDVSGTALAGVQPGTAVVINPTSKSLNITSGGLIMAFCETPDVISFGVKLQSGSVDLLVSVP